MIKIPSFGIQENTHFLQKIKKQLKETKDELKLKDEELQNYKKNIKFTKLKELQVENQVYYDETIRLKEILNTFLAEEINYKSKYANCYKKQIKIFVNLLKLSKYYKFWF